MKKAFFIYIFVLLLSSIGAQNNNAISDVDGKVNKIMNFINRNNLLIYKDGTILTNQSTARMYIVELINKIGKRNDINFTVRTKRNGLYNAFFLIRDQEPALKGNLFYLTDNIGTSISYMPIESLDVIALLYRYKENEDLILNDYIYLLNSMLYKDETLKSMIDAKIKSKENVSSEDKDRLVSMTGDLIANKTDVVKVCDFIINLLNKESSILTAKSNRTKEENDIIAENKESVKIYTDLQLLMKQKISEAGKK